MGRLTPAPTAYALLGIHPSAPIELADAAYWWAVIDLQKQRTAGRDADGAIYALTRAFETLSDVQRRADYNLSIGYQTEPLISRRSLQLRNYPFSRIVRRGAATAPVIDYYEVIGLDDSAPSHWAANARRIMRDHYLKASDDRRKELLLSLLDEAFGVISDVSTRAQYDAKRCQGTSNLGQRSGGNSHSPTTSPDQTAGDLVDESTLPAESKLPAESPAGAPEGAVRLPKRPPRIAPRVATGQNRRPVSTPAAWDNSAQQQQPSARSEITSEPELATAPALPSPRAPLLTPVVQVARGTIAGSGRAAVVLGRAGAAPIRGTITLAAKALRNRPRKHASDRLTSQARREQPKRNAGSQEDVESILLGRLESTLRNEPSSHPPDEPTD